jgi:hypothetical protein
MIRKNPAQGSEGPVGTNGCPQGDTAGMLLGSAGDIDGDGGCHRGFLYLRD